MAATVVGILCLSAHVSLGAQDRDPTDADNTARIQFIERALDAGQTAADRWWYGWLIAYGAAGAAQTAYAVNTDDQHQRQDLGIGALTSFVGAAGQFVFPLHAGRYARALHMIPGETPEQRAAKATLGERYLDKAAAEESFGRSWKSQASSVAVNGAAGLLTSLAFDRPAKDGLTTFAIGQAVSELQFFTQPLKAVHDLASYRRQRNTPDRSADADAPAVWSVSISASRLKISYVF